MVEVEADTNTASEPSTYRKTKANTNTKLNVNTEADVDAEHNSRGVKGGYYYRWARAPFAWYGGKYYYAEWIIGHFPEHRVYLEPFGGAGNILLNKIESEVEIFNDLDGRVANFFKVLRKRDKFAEMVRMLSLTPYSRSDFVEIITGPEPESDVERACNFFVRCRQSRGGLGMSKLGPTSWAVSLRSRRKMAEPVSKYLSAIEGLEDVANRFRSVVVENSEALTVIDKYDRDDALIYCDPPYVPDSRHHKQACTYGCEMTVDDHVELLDKLNKCKAKVVISGYHSEIYDKALTQWNRDTRDAKSHVSNSGQKRTEVIWKNF